jgi:hypothetical protein
MYTSMGMNIDAAVIEACKQPSLIDALSWIAVWESERAIKQARVFHETGKPQGVDGAGWDTCFKICFEKVFEHWTHPEGIN